jgi:hypothetical protein
MANETNTTVETTKIENPTTPTVEELMAQLATAKADAEKYKTANDKLSKSEAEMKRQLRAKQTAEEQEAETKAEAERLQKEELETLRKELNYNKALSAYKSISDDKAVAKLIEAVSNADHNEIAKIIASECQKAVANAQVEWLENRPPVNHGGENAAMTKDEIMRISDPIQRQQKIAENINLFRK